MKFFATIVPLVLFAFGCATNETATRLMTDQKLLKDSANNINARIDYYVRKGVYDSAEVYGKQLAAIHARLAEIQASIDSRSKAR